jgi:hypothetical protein
MQLYISHTPKAPTPLTCLKAPGRKTSVIDLKMSHAGRTIFRPQAMTLKSCKADKMSNPQTQIDLTLQSSTNSSTSKGIAFLPQPKISLQQV